MDGTDGRRFGFLHGADMDPTAVRAARPGARFVARARTEGLGGGEVWGILLDLGDDPVEGGSEAVPTSTDDGRPFAAVPLTGPAALADPVATLAAARYWELHPAYVARLRAAAGADPNDEE